MLRLVISLKRLRFSRLPALVFVGLVLFSGLAFMGMVLNATSLFTHFHFYLALSWGLWLLAFASLPRLRRCFWVPKLIFQVGTVMLLAHSGAVGSLWIGAAQADLASPNHLDIVWFNSHHQLAGITDLEKLLAPNLPDIIAIAEVGPEVELDLPGFNYIWRSSQNSGMLIASRFPLENQRILASSAGARDQLLVDVIVERRRFKLMAVHLRKPYERGQIDELKAIAATVVKLSDVIVVGDFNTTPWSAQFRNLCRDAELQHAGAGFGLLNSFGLSRWRLFPIPIDHMLMKGAIGIESIAVLPWLNSDHHPIRARFLLGTPRGRKARSNH